MAEKSKRMKSAVVVMEYQVVRPRSALSRAGSSVELPDINNPSSPRRDLLALTGPTKDFNSNEIASIKPLSALSSRRNSRQDDIVKSMISQISEMKVPVQAIASAESRAVTPRSSRSAVIKGKGGRRMSVQEKIVIVKEQHPLKTAGNSSPHNALLVRRQSEPVLSFTPRSHQNKPHHNRSDGTFTNTTESSGGQEHLVNHQRDSKIVEEPLFESELDKNGPEYSLAIEKCRSWINDLPEKFSGLNVLTFPEIQKQ